MATPAASSLSGIALLIEYARATRDMAEARGFVNLAAKLSAAIQDAEGATSLAPGDRVRVQAFSRLKALQRDAMRAFARDRDTEPPASA